MLHVNQCHQNTLAMQQAASNRVVDIEVSNFLGNTSQQSCSLDLQITRPPAQPNTKQQTPINSGADTSGVSGGSYAIQGGLASFVGNMVLHNVLAHVGAPTIGPLWYHQSRYVLIWQLSSTLLPVGRTRIQQELCFMQAGVCLGV
jgi:hypothetical protein